MPSSLQVALPLHHPDIHIALSHKLMNKCDDYHGICTLQFCMLYSYNFIWNGLLRHDVIGGVIIFVYVTYNLVLQKWLDNSKNIA